MKTLYLSDLDGTLLGHNQRMSQFTKQTVNNFVAGGGLFSYATARSIVTASKVTEGLNTGLPLICNDGAVILDAEGKKVLKIHNFSKQEIAQITNIFAQYDFYPIVCAYIDGRERLSYIKRGMSAGMSNFIDERIDDVRLRVVEEAHDLYCGDIFNIYFIRDNKDELATKYEFFIHNKPFHVILQLDVYHNYWFFVILPAAASKATAALELKKLLGCERLVVFGDGANDISMFKVADESYAMTNAVDELKEIATAVIESNEEDGVAKWIAKNLM
ncbi:MAG: HAD family hydrolase [Defluviitaleaceae bacterium]|nr:HAD family hydrolase [Defluviitaleaceae bacterium]